MSPTPVAPSARRRAAARRRARALVSVAVLVVPLASWPFGEDPYALPKTLLLTVLLAGAHALPWRRPSLTRSSDAWAVAGMVGLALVSWLAAGGGWTGVSGERQQLQGLWSLGLYAAAWALGGPFAGHPRGRRWLARTVGVSAAVVAIVGVVEAAGMDPTFGAFVPRDARIIGTIGQPNALAAYLAMTLPCTVALAATSASSRSRAGWMMAAAASAIAILAAGSRGAVLGLLAGGATWVVVERRGIGRRAVLRAMAAAAIALAIAAAAIAPLSPGIRAAALRTVGIGDPYASQSVREHLDLWNVGLRVALDHPILGIGPERFPDVFPDYRDRFLSGDRRAVFLPFRVESPHSVYAAWAAGIGFPGLLAYLLVIVLGIRGYLRALARGGGSRDRALLVAGLVGLVIHAVTDAAVTAEVSSSWLFWLLLGAGSAASRDPVTAPEDPAARRGVASISAGLLYSPR